MEGGHPAAPPVLSTPDTRVFEDQASIPNPQSLPRLSLEQVYITYEIRRTVDEIHQGNRKRIALQFPDHLLVDAARVYQELSRGLKNARSTAQNQQSADRTPLDSKESTTSLSNDVEKMKVADEIADEEEKLFILADTSYGACCVDEVAAEHADADVVVHYGRSCLSPTARLPVIYVFTKPPLDVESLCTSFAESYKDHSQKIILMADVPYQEYLPTVSEFLKAAGYKSIFKTDLVHNVASPLPNRTVPPDAEADEAALRDYSLFHISEPPSSLLLTVSSRVGSIFIYPTAQSEKELHSTSAPILSTSTASLLRRRYALLTRLSTAPVIGILINTLSVASYLDILAHLKSLIASYGKRAYTFVVGKVNAAKVANFAEVGGWVVIGCWESSLFDNTEFWKPVVTPWELEIALKPDDERVWTGQWRGDFGVLLGKGGPSPPKEGETSTGNGQESGQDSKGDVSEVDDTLDEQISDDESAPPEYDFRLGRYVSHSRPMGYSKQSTRSIRQADLGNPVVAQTALVKKANGDLTTIGGAVSPAAEFFKNQRSWQGLGSDFEIEYDSEGRMKTQEPARVEEGRRGIARGYVVGDEREKH